MKDVGINTLLSAMEYLFTCHLTRGYSFYHLLKYSRAYTAFESTIYLSVCCTSFVYMAISKLEFVSDMIDIVIK